MKTQSILNLLFQKPIRLDNDFLIGQQRFQNMNPMQDQAPFRIIHNYRKTITRRDRRQKKRNPKLYPPTSIKTRSMENSPKTQDLPFDLIPECHFAFLSSTFVSDDRHVPELCLIEENEKELRKNDSIDLFSYDDYHDHDQDNPEEKDMMIDFSDQIIIHLEDQEILRTY